VFQFLHQRGPNDCFIAAIVMLTGLPYEQVHDTAIDCGSYVPDKGTGDGGKILQRLGYRQENMALSEKNFGPYRGLFRSLWVPFGVSPDLMRFYCWGRPAIFSVPSLNIEGGTHAVFYTGSEVWDPNPPQKHRYTEFDKLKPEHAYVLEVR
jgi:hypothetical protein